MLTGGGLLLSARHGPLNSRKSNDSLHSQTFQLIRDVKASPVHEAVPARWKPAAACASQGY